MAATKTYTAQLMVIAMLAASLRGSATMTADLSGLPRLARATLDDCGDIARWASQYGSATRLTVLGRGYNYATACEISLKIKELKYIAADGYSEADFRHGPIAVVEPGYPIILVAPRGKTVGSMREICGILNDKGADTLIISDDPDMLSRGGRSMPIPQVAEWLSPIISVMPGQVFAMRQAMARGLEVDKPRGLAKVTITA